jgi:asparagine synthase (glutamine-hydrolysing)
MLLAQANYGPENRRVLFHTTIALGANYRSILPEDHDGFFYQSRMTRYLVADLRLDNRDELARKLDIPDADGLPDLAILLKAWDRWGSDCLEHLLGAFAFAVWDPTRKELFAARDHTGERPLFYHQTSGQFALASMPAGLLALPFVSAEPDEQHLVDWMSLSPQDPASSAFAQIKTVPPAHFLRVRSGHFECRPYWHPCDAAPIRYRRDSDYAEALTDLLDRATLPRLRTIGEVGSQLSAGLDSSSVAATAARLLDPPHRLTAFTAVPQPGFPGEGVPGRISNEGFAAAEVARLYPNMDHVQVHSANYDLLAELEAWTEAIGDLPTNGINFLWFSAILDQARSRGINVLLHGTFGNFTISQSGRDQMQSFFRSGRWPRLFRFANSLRTHGEMPFRQSFFHATNGLIPMALKRRLRPGISTLTPDFTSIHPELAEKYHLRERFVDEAYADLPDLETQRRHAFDQYDFGPTNAGIAARFGVEPRDPLGDKRIFEFCFAIPPEQYVVDNQSRSLIRRAMRGRLPHSTLQRFARGQQGADWYLTVERALPSFRQELELQRESALASRFVDLPRLQYLVDNFPTSGFQTNEIADSWNFALTRGITLGNFLRRLNRQ